MSCIAYTDGSCSPNPGPGGWAFIYIAPEPPTSFGSGREDASTNNRMELRAVMECIRFHKEKLPNLPLTIHSDSQLTINCATKLWKRNANLDMWAEYDELVRGTVINFVKVKAHSGDPYNTMVDDLANDARCGC